MLGIILFLGGFILLLIGWAIYTHYKEEQEWYDKIKKINDALPETPKPKCQCHKAIKPFVEKRSYSQVIGQDPIKYTEKGEVVYEQPPANLDTFDIN